jgi:hypothetical protein
MGKGLTEDQFKMVLPSSMKRVVNQELMDSINNTINDPEALEVFRENLLSYTNVMQQGRFKITSYISAIKYVSFKLLGSTNIDAYIKTFPDKYTKFIANGVLSKDIASYSTAYNKSKLVNLIFEQTLVPTHVLNAHLYQDALNTQADLMMNAKSEKVRSDAANSLLTHLKRPEVQKFELDIGVKEDSSVHALRATTLALVEQQKQMLLSGIYNAKQIANSELIIDAEVVD